MGHIEKIQSCLISQVSNQIEHLESVNVCELGEVIDMIKDLEEILYYHTIIESMSITSNQSS